MIKIPFPKVFHYIFLILNMDLNHLLFTKLEDALKVKPYHTQLLFNRLGIT